jgi:hypothetical protein
MTKPRKRTFDSPVTLSGNPLTGVLLEPIETAYGVILPDAGDKMIDAKLAELREMAVADANHQQFMRILALMAHYQISVADGLEGAFFALSMKLARDFIPGFQVNVEPKEHHRPQGTFIVGGAHLFEAVQARIAVGEDIKTACKFLSRTKGRWQGHSPKALESAYHRFFKKTETARAYLDSHPIYGALVGLVGIHAVWEHAYTQYGGKKIS